MSSRKEGNIRWVVGEAGVELEEATAAVKFDFLEKRSTDRVGRLGSVQPEEGAVGTAKGDLLTNMPLMEISQSYRSTILYHKTPTYQHSANETME